jgi:hypothetical protein
VVDKFKLNILNIAIISPYSYMFALLTATVLLEGFDLTAWRKKT